MVRNITLIYTAEGHPTAVRLTRFRKKFGWRVFHRNLSFWNPGEMESCSLVIVESESSPVAVAYRKAGVEVKVLKQRKPHEAPVIITDVVDEPILVKSDTPPLPFIPMSAVGQKKLKAHKKKSAKLRI